MEATEIPTDRELITAQPGPQYNAACHWADILIFGGSAGGGKTWYLEYEPMRHVHVPGFRGVIIRRTTTEITDEGGLWQESFNLYPSLGGIPKLQKHRWVFPAGSSIRFRHLETIDLTIEWKGTQACYLGFDQLEDIPESAFFYILSRNRSMCGVKPYVRATCNPKAGSWLAVFLAWWIDQETGYPIPERDGKVRWLAREADRIKWYDTEQEALDDNPELVAASQGEWRPKSVTFIRSRLEDNVKLMERDPSYLSNLLSLPKIERMRLYDGNWKIAPDSIIQFQWIAHVDKVGEGQAAQLAWQVGGTYHKVGQAGLRRFAVIDTAGTGQQLAQEKKGKGSSFTACGVFDYERGSNMLIWRDVYRKRVSWHELLAELPVFLDKWGVRELIIENAHFGPALKDEMRKGYKCKMVNPKIKGMQTGRGAKLERAIASGFLTRLEQGLLLFDPDGWQREHTNLLIAWTGLDDEVADLIDVGSYASVHCRADSRVLVA